MQDKAPWPVHSREINKAKQLLDAGVAIELTYLVTAREINCDICGDYHDEDNIPLSCLTGDGE